MVRLRLLMFLAGTVLAVTGLALGAATQGEELLKGVGDSDLASRDASGSLILLTALVSAVGIGLAAAAFANGPTPWRTLLLLVGASWLTLALLQTDLPNYTAVPEAQQATMSQTHMIREAVSSPSTLFPIMAIALGGILAMGAAFKRINPMPAASLRSLVKQHQALTALAAPMLLMLAIGNVRVLLVVPSEAPASTPALVILPVAALAALALAILLLVRQETLRRWLPVPHMAPVTRESLRAVDRLQTITLGLLLFTAVASTANPLLALNETSLGRSFVMTLRSHGQAAVLILILFAPLIRVQRRLAALVTEDTPPTVAAHGAPLMIALGVGTVAAVALTFTGQALAPWIGMFVPLAVWAGLRASPIQAAPIMLLTAWALWARGDTVVGFYDGAMFPPLTLATPPGLLALWRLGAVMLAGWALFRLGRQAGEDEPAGVVIPLAVVMAVGFGLVALIELPLTVWSLPGGGNDTVIVGSLVASQSPAVRVLAHGLAGLAGLAAGLAAARLLRPEWFKRELAPVDASSPSAAGA